MSIEKRPEMRSMIIVNDSPRVLFDGIEQIEFSLPLESHEAWLETGVSTHFTVSPNKKREGYNLFVEINPDKKKKHRVRGEHRADKPLTPDNFFDFEEDKSNPNKVVIPATLTTLALGGVAMAYIIARGKKGKE